MRKDAPNNLLIGPDVQPQLGLFVMTKNNDGEITDHFTGQQTLSLGTGCDRQAKTVENLKSRLTQFLSVKEALTDTTSSQPGSGSSRLPVELEVLLLQHHMTILLCLKEK